VSEHGLSAISIRQSSTGSRIRCPMTSAWAELIWEAKRWPRASSTCDSQFRHRRTDAYCGCRGLRVSVGRQIAAVGRGTTRVHAQASPTVTAPAAHRTYRNRETWSRIWRRRWPPQRPGEHCASTADTWIRSCRRRANVFATRVSRRLLRTRVHRRPPCSPSQRAQRRHAQAKHPARRSVRDPMCTG
jgi:hypothetical protein